MAILFAIYSFTTQCAAACAHQLQESRDILEVSKIYGEAVLRKKLYIGEKHCSFGLQKILSTTDSNGLARILLVYEDI